jgi:hypothetical protein
MGVIIFYINSDFNLIYKLIGFKDLNTTYTGLNMFDSFLDILADYRSINLNTIFRYVYYIKR